MATVHDRHRLMVDENGVPWFEDGERLDRATFHERYSKTTQTYRAELIGGTVHIPKSRVTIQ